MTKNNILNGQQKQEEEMKKERTRDQRLYSIHWEWIMIKDMNCRKINYHADLVLREADTFPADRNFVHEAV